MADNIDHNQENVDGRNTMHWMGMALAITPACPETHQLIHRLEVSLTYKERTIESGNNKHGYLDLLWKCKQLIFSYFTPLVWSDAGCFLEI